MKKSKIPLLIGEVFIDFTLPTKTAENKLRLGGVVHAARGLWAIDQNYALAAICPKYLVEQVKLFVKAHGCLEFIWLGEILGAPNVLIIRDATEISHQGYEVLLRNEKQAVLFTSGVKFLKFSEIIIFPGKYDLLSLEKKFSNKARFNFDVGYDVESLKALETFKGKIGLITLSTSSDLFLSKGAKKLEALLSEIRKLSPEVFLLKENRGGSRLFNFAKKTCYEIPATLGETSNSVGVGDVFFAVMVGIFKGDWVEAGWRGAKAATFYSQTTFPDDFKRGVKRELKLSLSVMQGLGGTFLPWHDRPNYQIYLAAPDFSYLPKPEIDKVIEVLNYHNFRVKRPVLEYGEVKPGATKEVLFDVYLKDYNLLFESDLIFAVPLGKDPGSLVEIGLAIEMRKPVITFDPRLENNNTMVMAGSVAYSNNLDVCLNKLFQILSDLRAKK